MNQPETVIVPRYVNPKNLRPGDLITHDTPDVELRKYIFRVRAVAGNLVFVDWIYGNTWIPNSSGIDLNIAKFWRVGKSAVIGVKEKTN